MPTAEGLIEKVRNNLDSTPRKSSGRPVGELVAFRVKWTQDAWVRCSSLAKIRLAGAHAEFEKGNCGIPGKAGKNRHDRHGGRQRGPQGPEHRTGIETV